MEDKIIEYVYGGPSHTRGCLVCKISEYPKPPEIYRYVLAYRCNAHPTRIKMYEDAGHPIWVNHEDEATVFVLDRSEDEDA